MEHNSPKEHKGWYSRGYLPHFDKPELYQGITFRLEDSLPKHVLDRDDDHLKVAARYIRDNPVKAGLVRRPEDWPFGSAARRERQRF